MRTDFSVFRERLAEACQVRNMTPAKLSTYTGLSPGSGALDLYRVCRIADVLDVSLDWLTGRSDVMGVIEKPEQPKRKAKKTA